MFFKLIMAPAKVYDVISPPSEHFAPDQPLGDPDDATTYLRFVNKLETKKNHQNVQNNDGKAINFVCSS